jgi:hypothetical protein
MFQPVISHHWGTDQLNQYREQLTFDSFATIRTLDDGQVKAETYWVGLVMNEEMFISYFPLSQLFVNFSWRHQYSTVVRTRNSSLVHEWFSVLNCNPGVYISESICLHHLEGIKMFCAAT